MSDSPDGGFMADQGADSIPSATPAPALKTHRGQLMLVLGIVSLVVGPPIVSVLTWVMAHNDLKEMDAGQMDPAGRQQTSTARLLAMISTVAWPMLFCCCCTCTTSPQLIYGGRFFSALGSRRITRQEFERVQPLMTKQQVRDLLGPPARTEGPKPDDNRTTWYWYEKNGPATFHVTITSRDVVDGVGSEWPD
jgi:hypothetical protein